MRCPFCNYHDSRVVDSRSVDDGASIRRRRECPDCGRRFTTYEKYEETPLVVNKKDGRRELFDSKKLLNGLIKAFEKRPISYEKIKEMADHIERELRMRGESEVSDWRAGNEASGKDRPDCLCAFCFGVQAVCRCQQFYAGTAKNNQ